MPCKPRKSKKKFYDKWNYKVTIKVPGIGIIRSHSLEDLEEKVSLYNTNNLVESRSYLIKDFLKNQIDILSLVSYLDQIATTAWQKRIESNCIDIYTNDREFYEKISNDFEEHLVHRFEPMAETSGISSDFECITVNKLPHDGFEFKVYLAPHRYKKNKDLKKEFIDWLDTQSNNVYITETVKKWFLHNDYNWDRRYMYVKDSKTLLMLKLRSSEAIGKIYQCVVVDK